ncbi:MAG: hypothetical protein HFE62_03010 [Firmicutes bacterium]|nr:hypothetical protein [Bacillota bacterium]
MKLFSGIHCVLLHSFEMRIYVSWEKVPLVLKTLDLPEGNVVAASARRYRAAKGVEST